MRTVAGFELKALEYLSQSCFALRSRAWGDANFELNQLQLF